MTIRNLSPATQQSYIYAVRKFSRHSGASPDRLGIEDVRAYQLQLIAKKRSWSHINQAGIVTLPREERERTTPQRFSSGRDDLVPRTHRRGA